LPILARCRLSLAILASFSFSGRGEPRFALFVLRDCRQLDGTSAAASHQIGAVYPAATVHREKIVVSVPEIERPASGSGLRAIDWPLELNPESAMSAREDPLEVVKQVIGCSILLHDDHDSSNLPDRAAAKAGKSATASATNAMRTANRLIDTPAARLRRREARSRACLPARPGADM
jgi:hypothetical protein